MPRPNGPDLAGLLARVEKASGPDREIDARLYVALIARLQNPAIEQMIADRAAMRPDSNVWLDGARDWQVKPYTASLDAVLGLCERVCADRELHLVAVDLLNEALEEMFVRGWRPNQPQAPQIARYLIAALLRALLSVPVREGEGDGVSVAGLPSSQEGSDHQTPLSAGKED